jgi:hypothetical protein
MPVFLCTVLVIGANERFLRDKSRNRDFCEMYTRIEARKKGDNEEKADMGPLFSALAGLYQRPPSQWTRWITQLEF